MDLKVELRNFDKFLGLRNNFPALLYLGFHPANVFVHHPPPVVAGGCRPPVHSSRKTTVVSALSEFLSDSRLNLLLLEKLDNPGHVFIALDHDQGVRLGRTPAQNVNPILAKPTGIPGSVWKSAR